MRAATVDYDRLALTDVVETLIARDEREGGRTMRELARLIVDNVLAQLEPKTEGMPRTFVAEALNSRV